MKKKIIGTDKDGFIIGDESPFNPFQYKRKVEKAEIIGMKLAQNKAFDKIKVKKKKQKEEAFDFMEALESL